jgi:hypothetical protein
MKGFAACFEESVNPRIGDAGLHDLGEIVVASGLAPSGLSSHCMRFA